MTEQNQSGKTTKPHKTDLTCLSRRDFLGGCAVCATGLAGVSALGSALAQETAGKSEKPRVRLIFTHRPSSNATWPNIGYDYDGR